MNPESAHKINTRTITRKTSLAALACMVVVAALFMPSMASTASAAPIAARTGLLVPPSLSLSPVLIRAHGGLGFSGNGAGSYLANAEPNFVTRTVLNIFTILPSAMRDGSFQIKPFSQTGCLATNGGLVACPSTAQWYLESTPSDTLRYRIHSVVGNNCLTAHTGATYEVSQCVAMPAILTTTAMSMQIITTTCNWMGVCVSTNPGPPVSYTTPVYYPRGMPFQEFDLRTVIGTSSDVNSVMNRELASGLQTLSVVHASKGTH